MLATVVGGVASGGAQATTAVRFLPGEVPVRVEDGGFRYFRVMTVPDPPNIRAAHAVSSEVMGRSS